jgi:hypothetical protein
MIPYDSNLGPERAFDTVISSGRLLAIGNECKNRTVEQDAIELEEDVSYILPPNQSATPNFSVMQVEDYRNALETHMGYMQEDVEEQIKSGAYGNASDLAFHSWEKEKIVLRGAKEVKLLECKEMIRATMLWQRGETGPPVGNSCPFLILQSY